MSAQITVTVYTFEELSAKARRRARGTIEPRIYDDEGWVADYCQEHEILFFESGRIACEDGDVVA